MSEAFFQSGTCDAIFFLFLNAPPTGAQTIHVFQGSAQNVLLGAWSFTGTVGDPSDGNGLGGSGSDYSFSVSNTTTIDMVLEIFGNVSNQAFTAASGQTLDSEMILSTSQASFFHDTGDAGGTTCAASTAASAVSTAAAVRVRGSAGGGSRIIWYN